MPQSASLDSAANQSSMPIDLDGMDFDGYESDANSDPDNSVIQSEEKYNSLITCRYQPN